MRNVKRVGAAVVAIAILAVMAGPVLGADATVGRFVQRAAQELKLNATDARAATDSLRAVGVGLPANLDVNKTLTERDVASIARALGVRVTTSNPDATFGTDKIDRFFQSFGGEIAASHHDDDCAVPGNDCDNPGQGGGPGNGNGGPPFDPFSKGRGSPNGKAKHGRTPVGPE